MGGLKQQTGGRSPLIRKSIDHIYGAKNIPSDNINNVVNNAYMEEAAILLQAKNEEIAKARAAIPKGLKAKQTLTSKLRREANKQEHSPMRSIKEASISLQ